MIAKLKGKIDELKPTDLILDVNGVGYHLSIPLSTYEKIQAQTHITLYVYTLHKEDQMRLFGFYTEKEKSLFSILINTSGIGPAIAIAILSGISVRMLVEAVKSNNPALLTVIPGIGKTKAEKLIFELKRKIKDMETFGDETIEMPTARTDAFEALVSLGFDEAKSSKAIDTVMQELPGGSIEQIIKEALKYLSRS